LFTSRGSKHKYCGKVCRQEIKYQRYDNKKNKTEKRTWGNKKPETIHRSTIWRRKKEMYKLRPRVV
jgi:hypothetical protein